MTRGRTPRATFVDDWPAGDAAPLLPGKHDGVGPRMTDEKCVACDGLISELGECRCSS